MTILELEIDEDLIDPADYQDAFASGEFSNRDEYISSRAQELLSRAIKRVKFTPRLKYYDRDKNIWVVGMKGEKLSGLLGNDL